MSSFQNEVDLGSRLWAEFEYDDSAQAAEAKRQLLESADSMGYMVLAERGGHLIHVVNTPRVGEVADAAVLLVI